MTTVGPISLRRRPLEQGASEPTGWTPDSDPTIQGRWSAAELSGYAHGDRMSAAGNSWPDSSGNLQHGTPVDDAGLIYSTSAWTQGGVRLTGNLTDTPFDIPGIVISAGDSVLMAVVMDVEAWGAGNPGYLREGNNFLAWRAATGLPWIRWDDDEILQPGSGDATPLGKSTAIYVVKSNDEAEFWINGVLAHSAFHTTPTVAHTYDSFGAQTTIQQPTGTIGELMLASDADSTNLPDPAAVHAYLAANWSLA